MRWAAKRDSNEPEIVKALERAGWTVVKVSDKGVPDLLCFRRGVVKMLEVKGPDGALTPAQVETFTRIHAALVTVHVVRTPEEALMAVGAPVESELKPIPGLPMMPTGLQRTIREHCGPGHVVTPAFQREQTEAVVPKKRRKA